MSAIEIVATLLGLAYVITNAKLNIVTWIFSFGSGILYVYIFYKAGLFASSILSIIFVCGAVYGWITWIRKSKSKVTDETQQTDAGGVVLFSNKKRISLLCIGLGIGFLFYAVLNYALKFEVIMADALISGFSIVGTYFAAQKAIESWIVWVLVNVAATILYFYMGLYLTAGLYAVYVGLSFYGLFQWIKVYKSEKAAAV